MDKDVYWVSQIGELNEKYFCGPVVFDWLNGSQSMIMSMNDFDF